MKTAKLIDTKEAAFRAAIESRDWSAAYALIAAECWTGTTYDDGSDALEDWLVKGDWQSPYTLAAVVEEWDEMRVEAID